MPTRPLAAIAAAAYLHKTVIKAGCAYKWRVPSSDRKHRAEKQRILAAMYRTIPVFALLLLVSLILIAWLVPSRVIALAVLALVALVVYVAACVRAERRRGEIARKLADVFRQVERGDFNGSVSLPLSSPDTKQIESSLDSMLRSLKERNRGQGSRLDQMDAVLSGMIEGVLATDSSGRVVLANRAACRMLSRSESGLVGHGLLETVRYPALRAAIEQSVITAVPRTVEITTIENHPRHILASVSALGGAATGGLAVVMHDVTELRKMETMRRDFVANVSHELKTPLAVIKACAETLSLGALHDPAVNEDFVRQIENQADQLDRHVQQLMELSRVQSGQAPLDLAPVDLNRMAEDVVRRFAAEAEKRKISLTLVPSPQVVVECDEDTLVSALNNLVSNALRYTSAGGSVAIHVRTEDDSAILEVVDTGIGIAPEFHERVFERFFRVDKSRSRTEGGTGLGLAIVKHRIQAIGGKVELESRVGKGSRFRVRIPGGNPGQSGAVSPWEPGG
jgi:two-component system, OmpR family, phosphate regulon sensor histidine kinase PhoR